jgi:hypothetical protein
MKRAMGLALAAAAGVLSAGAARGQTASFSVILVPSGPGGPGTTVNATVRVTWSGGGAIGLAGGRMRLRLEGLGACNVPLPSEASSNRVGVPLEQLPPGGGTVSVSWTDGRRPKRAYLVDASDPSSLTSGGGFRSPPVGTGPTDLRYAVVAESGAVYVTATDAGGNETWVRYAQTARNALTDPVFFEPGAAIDLLKFRFQVPGGNAHTVRLVPEVQDALLYTDGAGGTVAPAVEVHAGLYSDLQDDCRLDVNGDGLVNVQDYLRFLELYAAGDPTADFNWDCGVNVQDFLSFLALYSAGCP